jgi:hypothetical protein
VKFVFKGNQFYVLGNISSDRFEIYAVDSKKTFTGDASQAEKESHSMDGQIGS